MKSIRLLPATSFLFVSMLVAVIPGSSALAFDCNKASTDVEHAICGNPELFTLDESMEQVYFSMKRRLDPAPGVILKSSQRHWLGFRNDYCEAEPACLSDETQSRLDRLAETDNAKPEMVPVFIWQKGGKNTYNVRVDGAKFAYPDTPGKARFNREFEKVIAAAPLNEKTENQDIGSWEQETHMQISRLNSRMISVTIGIYEYAGGAHPNSWQNAINIDLGSGKLMKSSKVFSKNTIEEFIDSCRDMIIDAKSNIYDGSIEDARKDIEEYYPGEVEKHIRDMTRWHFNEEGATITFNAYSIGSYAEGTYECTFPQATIDALATTPEIMRQ